MRAKFQTVLLFSTQHIKPVSAYLYLHTYFQTNWLLCVRWQSGGTADILPLHLVPSRLHCQTVPKAFDDRCLISEDLLKLNVQAHNMSYCLVSMHMSSTTFNISLAMSNSLNSLIPEGCTNSSIHLKSSNTSVSTSLNVSYRQVQSLPGTRPSHLSHLTSVLQLHTPFAKYLPRPFCDFALVRTVHVYSCPSSPQSFQNLLISYPSLLACYLILQLQIIQNCASFHL